MICSVGHKFLAPEDSICWAQDAINELDQLITEFFKGDIAKIVTEFDSKTGENVQKLKFLADIPKNFRRKATEALISAKHSFDQTIFTACNVISPRPISRVNYPWSQSPTDLDRLLTKRGVNPEIWDTIRKHQPYPTSDSHSGGDDLIRTLATIANNKHTIGLSVNGQIESIRFPDIRGGITQSMKILSPIWNPQKNEAELIKWIGDVKIDGDYNFAFKICLKDSR